MKNHFSINSFFLRFSRSSRYWPKFTKWNNSPNGLACFRWCWISQYCFL